MGLDSRSRAHIQFNAYVRTSHDVINYHPNASISDDVISSDYGLYHRWIWSSYGIRGDRTCLGYPFTILNQYVYASVKQKHIRTCAAWSERCYIVNYPIFVLERYTTLRTDWWIVFLESHACDSCRNLFYYQVAMLPQNFFLYLTQFRKLIYLKTFFKKSHKYPSLVIFSFLLLQ